MFGKLRLAQNSAELFLASAVASLAHDDDGAALVRRAIPQQPDRGGEGVIEARAAVAGPQIGDRLFDFIVVRAEGKQSLTLSS